MALPIRGSTQGEYSERGIIVQKVVIAGAEDISGQQLTFMREACDVGVRLILDIGRTFTPELTIAGRIKKDESGKAISWGGAFVVHDLFVRLGIKDWKTEDDKLSADAIPQLINKEFFRLSYVTGRREDGKLRYSDWMEIGAIEDGAEAFVARFKKKAESGYPSNYNPKALEEEVPGAPAFP